jgi:hypothetical protein
MQISSCNFIANMKWSRVVPFLLLAMLLQSCAAKMLRTKVLTSKTPLHLFQYVDKKDAEFSAAMEKLETPEFATLAKDRTGSQDLQTFINSYEKIKEIVKKSKQALTEIADKKASLSAQTQYNAAKDQELLDLVLTGQRVLKGNLEETNSLKGVFAQDYPKEVVKSEEQFIDNLTACLAKGRLLVDEIAHTAEVDVVAPLQRSVKKRQDDNASKVAAVQAFKKSEADLSEAIKPGQDAESISTTCLANIIKMIEVESQLPFDEARVNKTDIAIGEEVKKSQAAYDAAWADRQRYFNAYDGAGKAFSDIKYYDKELNNGAGIEAATEDYKRVTEIFEKNKNSITTAVNNAKKARELHLAFKAEAKKNLAAYKAEEAKNQNELNRKKAEADAKKIVDQFNGYYSRILDQVKKTVDNKNEATAILTKAQQETTYSQQQLDADIQTVSSLVSSSSAAVTEAERLLPFAQRAAQYATTLWTKARKLCTTQQCQEDVDKQISTLKTSLDSLPPSITTAKTNTSDTAKIEEELRKLGKQWEEKARLQREEEEKKRTAEEEEKKRKEAEEEKKKAQLEASRLRREEEERQKLEEQKKKLEEEQKKQKEEEEKRKYEEEQKRLEEEAKKQASKLSDQINQDVQSLNKNSTGNQPPGLTDAEIELQKKEQERVQKRLEEENQKTVPTLLEEPKFYKRGKRVRHIFEGFGYDVDANIEPEPTSNFAELYGFDYNNYKETKFVGKVVRGYSELAGKYLNKVKLADFDKIATLEKSTSYRNYTGYLIQPPSKVYLIMQNTEMAFKPFLSVGTFIQLVNRFRTCSKEYQIYDWHGGDRWIVSGNTFTQILDVVIFGCTVTSRGTESQVFRGVIAGRFKSANPTEEDINVAKQYTLSLAYKALSRSISN